MKKLTKTFLSIVLGFMVCGTTTLSASAQKERIDEQFSILEGSSIYIDLSVVDADIGVSPDDTVYISYYNIEDIEYEIEQYDDELTVKQIKLKEDVSFNFNNNPKLTVLIPKQFNGDLTIDSGVGSVSVSDVFVRSIDVHATTGFIKAKRIFSAGDITLRTGAGSITVADVYSASNTVTLKGTTGFIKFSELDAQNITIDMGAGSIHGSIVGNESDFTGESSSRFINNLPEYWGSGSKTLYVSTTTGIVNVSFTE